MCRLILLHIRVSGVVSRTHHYHISHSVKVNNRVLSSADCVSGLRARTRLFASSPLAVHVYVCTKPELNYQCSILNAQRAPTVKPVKSSQRKKCSTILPLPTKVRHRQLYTYKTIYSSEEIYHTYPPVHYRRRQCISYRYTQH